VPKDPFALRRNAAGAWIAHRRGRQLECSEGDNLEGKDAARLMGAQSKALWRRGHGHAEAICTRKGGWFLSLETRVLENKEENAQSCSSAAFWDAPSLDGEAKNVGRLGRLDSSVGDVFL